MKILTTGFLASDENMLGELICFVKELHVLFFYLFADSLGVVFGEILEKFSEWQYIEYCNGRDLSFNL